jgi:protein-disulfide isomerase
MKRLSLPLTLALTLTLAACVDTTGLSPESNREVAGNPNSPVVVTEFADLQCPACRAAHTTLNKPLLEKYGSQVRFEFRHFPLRNLHRYALDLAEASECVADQDPEKFWGFVDVAFEKQQELKNGVIRTWVEELKGMDMALFDRCTQSHIKRDGIIQEYENGQELGVQGTPTYFVNGRQTEATLEGGSSAIEGALSGAGQRL